MVLGNDRQALLLARRNGAACGLLALDFMYYLPLGTTTCRAVSYTHLDVYKRQGLLLPFPTFRLA